MLEAFLYETSGSVLVGDLWNRSCWRLLEAFLKETSAWILISRSLEYSLSVRCLFTKFIYNAWTYMWGCHVLRSYNFNSFPAWTYMWGCHVLRSYSFNSFPAWTYMWGCHVLRSYSFNSFLCQWRDVQHISFSMCSHKPVRYKHKFESLHRWRYLTSLYLA